MNNKYTKKVKYFKELISKYNNLLASNINITDKVYPQFMYNNSIIKILVDILNKYYELSTNINMKEFNTKILEMKNFFSEQYIYLFNKFKLLSETNPINYKEFSKTYEKICFLNYYLAKCNAKSKIIDDLRKMHDTINFAEIDSDVYKLYKKELFEYNSDIEKWHSVLKNNRFHEVSVFCNKFKAKLSGYKTRFYGYDYDDMYHKICHMFRLSLYSFNESINESVSKSSDAYSNILRKDKIIKHHNSTKDLIRLIQNIKDEIDNLIKK